MNEHAIPFWTENRQPRDCDDYNMLIATVTQVFLIIIIIILLSCFLFGGYRCTIVVAYILSSFGLNLTSKVNLSTSNTYTHTSDRKQLLRRYTFIIRSRHGTGEQYPLMVGPFLKLYSHHRDLVSPNHNQHHRHHYPTLVTLKNILRSRKSYLSSFVAYFCT